MMKKLTVPAISGLLLMSATAAAEPSRVIMVGNFAEGDKSGWEEQEFKGKTSYTITPGKKGNQSLEVRSAASVAPAPESTCSTRWCRVHGWTPIVRWALVSPRAFAACRKPRGR